MPFKRQKICLNMPYFTHSFHPLGFWRNAYQFVIMSICAYQPFFLLSHVIFRLWSCEHFTYMLSFATLSNPFEVKRIICISKIRHVYACRMKALHCKLLGTGPDGLLCSCMVQSMVEWRMSSGVCKVLLPEWTGMWDISLAHSTQVAAHPNWHTIFFPSFLHLLQRYSLRFQTCWDTCYFFLIS